MSKTTTQLIKEHEERTLYENGRGGEPTQLERKRFLQEILVSHNEKLTEALDKLMEELASLEHERWSKWQKYMHSKCVEHENGKGEFVCLPADSFRRWERQINTPYAELTEAEKESDRAEVRPYLELIKAVINA